MAKSDKYRPPNPNSGQFLHGEYKDRDGYTYEYNYSKLNKKLLFSVTDKYGITTNYNIKSPKYASEFLFNHEQLYKKTATSRKKHESFIRDNVKKYISEYVPLHKQNVNYFINIENQTQETKKKKSKSIEAPPENGSKSKAFKDLFEAVKANNLLRKYFYSTKITDSNSKEIHPASISTIEDHNRLVNDIKQTICDGLLKGNSVILQAREGIDYSFNASNQKPFENVQQLYMQQIRQNKNFKNPYFMSSSHTRTNGFTIKKDSLSTILSNINKQTSKIEFNCFYNGNQLENNSKTLDLTNNSLNKNLNIPFVLKQDKIPEVKLYEPKSFTLVENLNKYVSEYFKSIYTGEPYTPPNYTIDEINKIVNYISNNDSQFFGNVQKAHRTVKNSLKMPVPSRQKDHSRRI
jgi:hypothetical protein